MNIAERTSKESNQKFTLLWLDMGFFIVFYIFITLLSTIGRLVLGFRQWEQGIDFRDMTWLRRKNRFRRIRSLDWRL